MSCQSKHRDSSCSKLSSIRLERIDHHTARRFFAAYEHLGDCGLGVWHWGAFLRARLISTVSFGTTCFGKLRGPLSSIADEFGLGIYQISRGGTMGTAPFNTPSRVISRALREFHRFKGDCIVVAYADRRYNEVGTIYQACNGIYLGLTQPKDQSNYLIFGRTMSGWMVRKKFGTRAMAVLKSIDRNTVKVPLTSKYRYVFVQAPPLKRQRVVEAMVPLAKPFPKRENENILPMNISALVTSRTFMKGLDRTIPIS